MKSQKLPVVKDSFPWKAAFRMIKDPVAFLRKQARETGDLYRIDAPIPFVVISGHEQIRHVLQTDWRKYRKGPAYKGFALMLGDGLLNSEGDKWRKQRKMIQPSFNKEQIGRLTELMLSNAQKLIEKWSPAAHSGNAVEIKSDMIDYSFNLIGTVLMGEECSGKYSPLLVPLIMKQYGFVMSQNRSFFKFPLWVPTAHHRSYFKTKKELQDLVFEIIDTKKNENDGTLLSNMIEAIDSEGAKMSELELHDEFLTLFGTGFDTTGSALSWALLLLASNKDKQEQLYQEIKDIKNSGQPLMAGLMQCEWLNAVVKETLRLYPSVWIIARKSIVEDEIDGMKIPKNAHVILCLFMTHRDPKFWDAPEEFQPERFIGVKDNPSYMPFGIGARMCIGNHFSHLEMITAIYTICSAYTIELGPNTQLEVDPKITLQPKGEVFIKLTPRT